MAHGFSGTVSILNTSRRNCMPHLGTTLATLNISTSHLSIMLVRVMELMHSNRMVGTSGHSNGTVALIALLSRMPVSTTHFFFGLHRPGDRFSFSLSLTIGRSGSGPICCIRCTCTEVYDVVHGLRTRNVGGRSTSLGGLVLLATPRRQRLVLCVTTLASRVVTSTHTCSPTGVARCIRRLTAGFRGFCTTYEMGNVSRSLVRTHLSLYRTATIMVGGILALVGVSTPRGVWRKVGVGGGDLGLAVLVSLCRLAVTGNIFADSVGSAMACFSVFFQHIPSGNNCTVVTNLRRLVRCVRSLRFSSRSVRCLGSLGLFNSRFLSCLGGFGFSYSI